MQSDIEQIEALTRRWVALWNVGTGPFRPDGFRDVFAPGAHAIQVFDNVMGDVVVLNSVDDYVAT